MRTHRLQTGYLVIGLIFLGIAGSWGLNEAGVIDGADTEWAFPLTLLVAGVVGLLVAAARGLSSKRKSEEGQS